MVTVAGVGAGGQHVFEVCCMRLCVSGSGGATFAVRFCEVVLFSRRGCACHGWSVCRVGHLGVVSRCTAFRALRIPENDMFLSVSSMLKSFFCGVILRRTGVWDICSPWPQSALLYYICCATSAVYCIFDTASWPEAPPPLPWLCSALP